MSSSKGIVIAAIERYEHLLYSNIQLLREYFNCQLPIEIWQIGQEISIHMQNQLESKSLEWKLSFKNVKDYTENPEHWRGFQIKAFILKHTNFEEVIISDCDSVFLTNPEIIYQDENYINTGTYFFKDYLYHNPKSQNEIDERKMFIRKLMPNRSKYLPEELYYLYDIPSKKPQMWFYQESGVVYLNKKLHPEAIETIYILNDNHKETYKYVHGDKETFWLAFLMVNKPFYMNEYPGINVTPNLDMPRIKGDLIDNKERLNPAFMHFYLESTHSRQTLIRQEKLICFFSQKCYPDVNYITKDRILNCYSLSPYYQKLILHLFSFKTPNF